MVTKAVLKRIRGKGRGWVFTPKDFLDLGSRAAVDQALSRLAQRDVIRRIDRGLYDCPQIDPRFGILSPSPDAVAKAVARKTDSQLQPSGALAANALRLSTQVPARRKYLTDGPNRRIQIGRQQIDLRHTTAKNLIGAGNIVGTVFQALRYLGRDGVTDSVIQRLRTALSANDRRALKRHAPHMPGWMSPIIDRLAPAA